jgi:hypothetical protein
MIFHKRFLDNDFDQALHFAKGSKAILLFMYS